MSAVKSNEFFYSTSELSEAILHRNSDPIEGRMNRTSNRICGAFLGLFSIGPLQGGLLADAFADGKKIQKVEQHLAKLSDADGNGLEKQIYTEIAQYTKSAQMIKLFSATIGAIAAIRLNYFETFDNLSAGCFFSFFAGVTILAIHRYTEGSAMKERHKQMILGQTALVL